MKTFEQQAVEFIGLRLQDGDRAKQITPQLLECNLLRHDGNRFVLDDADRRLLAIEPRLLSTAELRRRHDAGDRSAWPLLVKAVGVGMHAKLEPIRELNHPGRHERQASLAAEFDAEMRRLGMTK